MGIFSEYEAKITNEVIKKYGKYNSLIKTNNEYLGAFNNNEITIYNLNHPSFNLAVENSITCTEMVNYIDFNPKYPQIILSALYNGDVKLWNISNKENKDKEICVFKGHSSYVKYALFNPEFSNTIISSDNKNIKIWDVNKYSHNLNVIHEDIIDKLKWNYSGDKFGYINNKCKLAINEIKEDKEKDKHKSLLQIHEQKENYINDFIFEGYHDIIVFYENRVKRWDMRKFNEPVKTYENFDIIPYLYDNKIKIFIFNAIQ